MLALKDCSEARERGEREGQGSLLGKGRSELMCYKLTRAQEFAVTLATMSKNKKGSKSHTEDLANWDEGIINEKISDVRQK